MYAKPVLIEHLKNELKDNLIVVTPDAGGAERARSYAKLLGCPMALIDKRRDKPNSSDVMHVIGDVKGYRAVIIDDIIDTAGTIVKAASALVEHGATEVYACCTHPVFSGPAISRLKESQIKEIIVTNTIPLTDAAKDMGKIKELSVAKLLGEAINRIHSGDSVSSLFV